MKTYETAIVQFVLFTDEEIQTGILNASVGSDEDLAKVDAADIFGF